jgi:hypothetical protein
MGQSPDAPIIATTKVTGCEAIVSNDLSWPKIEVPEVTRTEDKDESGCG